MRALPACLFRWSLPLARRVLETVERPGGASPAMRLDGLCAGKDRLREELADELMSSLAELRQAADAVSSGQDREAAVRMLYREIERLSILVEALPSANRAHLEPASRRVDVVALGELLEQVAGDCTSEAISRHCGIALEIEAPATLRGNSELLRRAMEFLVRNAIQFSPKLSMIEMKLRRRDGRAEVVVRDFGPGVPEEELDRVLDPLSSVEGIRTAAACGTGLGLLIARHAIAMHRGKLSARNSHPGLAVTVELPLASA